MSLVACCLGTRPSQFFQDCPSCQYRATGKKMAEAVVASGACRVQTHCAQGTEAKTEPPAEGPSPGQCAGHTCSSAPPTLRPRCPMESLRVWKVSSPARWRQLNPG